jgi:superfamily I DNA and RNA helicase
VLYATPEDRQQRRTGEGTLGEQFDEAAEAYKVLSDEQQRLSAMNWEGGPRQVRGVAGSGKTIVLANNLARRIERMLIGAQEGLFGPQPARPRLLAVCFNRTLAPFIEKKINIAFQQRTGRPVPEGMVEVCSFNSLMWKLTTAGLWQYQHVTNADDMARALQYLGALEPIKQRQPERLAALAYDAIYVDEGQDFLEEEFRLLKELCRVQDGQEPNLYVFYDDAQNLYGRSRPNWQSLGLNVRGGRSFVMTQCFRNTRAIVEATFNVLYGSCAPPQAQVPTKVFGDLGSLEQKGLIENDEGFWRVRFTKREGMKPRLSLANTMQQENELLISRLRWLIEEQEVRPEDIQVLAFTRQRVEELAEAVRVARVPAISGVHVAFNEKDKPLGQKGHLTLSTVASAKGYDAYCVLLASANEFTTDVTGRASFYVGCTRAIEYLEVFAYENKGLVSEMETVLARIKD